MKQVLKGILIATLLTVGNSMTASTQEEKTTPTDSATVDSVPVQVAPDEALAQEKAKVGKLIKENSQLKQEINSLKKKVRELEGDKHGMEASNRSLQDAMTEAMPIVEAGIFVKYSMKSVDFENADIAQLRKYASTFNILSPYSQKIKAKADTLNLLIKLTGKYRQVSNFDAKPYSAELFNKVETALFDIIDNGGKLLNDTRSAQVDSIYSKANNYRAAVETFDSIIKDVDATVSEYRSNDKADNLARSDTKAILEKDAAKVAEIKAYSYLAKLYSRYCAELDKAPRSLTEDIRQEIARMLGTATPATEGDESSEDASGDASGEA